MILLKANTELQKTFEKLIETMKVPVNWNGVFAVVDNYMILQGEVRSLLFHFDSKKVATNIIEIPEQEKIEDIGGNVRIQNAINMILYAFGKWGTISGIRVDKDYRQLQALFQDIMHEYGVEPEFTPMYLRFYRGGMRITYEDVIQMGIEFDEEEEVLEESQSRGLWRKIIWKKGRAVFEHVETNVEERKATRLGRNFYMVGYLCPVCEEKLHMVVYPEGKEFRIETEEGGVLLARAATCRNCRNFYTPRPKKLLIEGDIYLMKFGDDEVAYDDYLDLLGRDGDRVSNYHCNEYEDGRHVPGEEEESLEELCVHLPELSDAEIRKIEARMEEGFYSDASTRKYENFIRQQREVREENRGKVKSNSYDGMSEDESGEASGREKEKHADRSNTSASVVNGRRSNTDVSDESDRKLSVDSVVDGRAGNVMSAKPEGKRRGDKAAVSRAEIADVADMSVREQIIIEPKERDEVRKKYDARIAMMDRYSERQLRELRGQLEREKKLMPEERRAYIWQVEDKLARATAAHLSEKAAACEGKSYVIIKRMLEEVEDAKIPEELKRPLELKLRGWKTSQAQREVQQLMQKMPKNLDRRQYKQYVQRMQDYEDVDMTPYEEMLSKRREEAECQEIANLVKRARKVSREDYVELADKLRGGEFLPELVRPYLEKVEERIAQIDAKAIELICPDPMHMTFAEGMQAYEQIEQGDFLPELKKDALKMLSKRLAKIKTDESELLVQKLKSELQENGVGENERHHFYPARRALMKQASPEETEVIEYAMASYAAGKGLFEYPILVVDTSRGETGKEGIILTPDHLYYSTMLSAYGVKLETIHKIEVSTGLLNKGLWMYQKDGTKTKLPYAVENRELYSFAKVLDEFIHYLKEKPDSRSLAYLAKEKHEKICCFRCGYEYQGGAICPKCGYQNNE